MQLLVASAAASGNPNAGNSTVPTGITLVGSRAGVPDPAGTFTIVVRDDTNDAMANTPVVLDFSAAPDLVLGSVQPHPGVSVTCNTTISGTTDANGVVSFVILGSGANRYAAPGTVGPAVAVRAGPSNTLIATISAAAFDLDGMNGVDHSDVALWKCDFGSAEGFARADYDFTGGVGASDVSALLIALASGQSRESSTPCVGGLVVAPVLESGGLGLGWDNCRTIAGIENKIFACNTNTGLAFHMIGSLTTPTEIAGIRRIETEIEITSTNGLIPAWWTNACRSAFTSPDPTASGSITCTVAGQASAISAIYPSEGNLGVQRLHLTTDLTNGEVTLAAGDETALLDIAISKIKTTGAGACAGCDVPVVIKLISMRLIQGDNCAVAPTSYPPDIVFSQTSGSNVARWQSADPVFPIAVDATDLGGYKLSGGVCRTVNATQNLFLSQGSYTIAGCSGTPYAFTVDGSGLVQYSPAFEGALSGAGTSTLGIHAPEVTIDVTQAPDAFYRIDSTACFPRAQVQTVKLTPGNHVVASCVGSCPALNSIGFGIDNNGNFTYDAAQEGALLGAGTSTLVVKSASFPPVGDDLTSSMGKFRVVVEPEFWGLMAGYPGYALINGVHRLVSPVVRDPLTRIGRSSIHVDGDAADLAGVPVGIAGTVVSDASFSLVPPGFAGPAGTAEVHTEIRSLNMTAMAGAIAVRAGTHAPGRPISPGEIEANPGNSGFFPAESFFNAFVEVDLPVLGTLYNSAPLMVENFGIACFPPQVVYLHKHTGPVPVHFKVADTQLPQRWQAGQRFGWLVLAGHGVDFDNGPVPASAGSLAAKQTQQDPDAAFLAIVDAEPEMADTATVVRDVHDIVLHASPSAFTQAAYRDSILNGIGLAVALGNANNPCAGLFEATRMHVRVDSLTSSPDWVTDHAVRRVLAARILELSAQLLAQANQSGGCQGILTTPPNVVPSKLALLGIQPNPSFGQSTIRYAVPSPQRVNLSVFDLSGRLVRVLVDADMPAGTFQAVWDGHQDRASGRAVSSGTYFVRMMAGGQVFTRRMVLVR